MAEEIKLEDQLKKKLHEGKVRFTFKKKDGTVRSAYGTTKMEFVPEERRPANKELEETTSATQSTVQVYYDLEKEAWRSLQKSSLVSIDE